MTEPMLAPAGPVFSIDGQRVPSMARDCVHLEIEEGVEGLRTLRLHLFATGTGATGPQDRMIWLDGGVVDFGKRITAKPVVGVGRFTSPDSMVSRNQSPKWSLDGTSRSVRVAPLASLTSPPAGPERRCRQGKLLGLGCTAPWKTTPPRPDLFFF